MVGPAEPLHLERLPIVWVVRLDFQASAYFAWLSFEESESQGPSGFDPGAILAWISFDRANSVDACHLPAFGVFGSFLFVGNDAGTELRITVAGSHPCIPALLARVQVSVPHVRMLMEGRQALPLEAGFAYLPPHKLLERNF